jgi:hypothetical protein
MKELMPWDTRLDQHESDGREQAGYEFNRAPPAFTTQGRRLV